MTIDPLEIIKFDFLYRKSSDSIKRALHRRGTEDPQPGESSLRDLFGEEVSVNTKEYQLWAAIALELLGKAALAKQHPCFLVDPRGPDSMLAAAGIGSRIDGTRIRMEGIKTISATEVYQRLKGLVPRYDDDTRNFCLAIAASRNAELHTAASPIFVLEPRLGPGWEETYWNTSKIILSHIGRSLGEWLGEENATEALRAINEASKARDKRKADIAIRIEMARQGFNELSDATRSAIKNKIKDIDLSTASRNFDDSNEKVWEVTCPACGNRSFMAGHETILSIKTSAELVDGESGQVRGSGRVFAPSVFICAACDLKLSDSDEIRFAGMYKTYQE